jgi:DNA primase
MHLDFSRIDAFDFLEQLGIEVHSSPGAEEIAICCPFHGESRPSCHMNSRTTAFRCKACPARGNAVHFLAMLEKMSLQEAAYHIKKQYDNTFREPKGGALAEFNATVSEKPRIVIPTEVVLDESIGKRFHPISDDGFRYLTEERGLTEKTIRELQLGWDNWSNRVTFPIRNTKGDLLGFKGRDIYGTHPAKYKVLGDGRNWSVYGFAMHDTSRSFYGAEDLPSETVIVVEGELDRAALYQMGYTSVALGGRPLPSTTP